MNLSNDFDSKITDYKRDAHGFKEYPLINQIVETVKENLCCSILGPLYSHKSNLLVHIQEEIEARLKRATILISIKSINLLVNNSSGKYDQQTKFLHSFAVQIAQNLKEKYSVDLSKRAEEVCNAFELKKFLSSCLRILDRDLVLMVDQLESADVKLIQLLLTVLRSTFSDHHVRGIHHFVVIIASSLRIASLSLGDSSPFNIAKPFLIDDLTQTESVRWLNYLAGINKVELTEEAISQLWKKAGGDRYLLRTLFLYSKGILPNGNIVGEKEISSAVSWFEKEEIRLYRPLQATIREIEENPGLLMDIITILKGSQNLKSNQKTISSPFESNFYQIGDLALSGAVTLFSNKEDQIYRIRNEIYKKHLRRYFSPQTVGNLLKSNHRWEEAIQYLSAFPKERIYLEQIVCDSIRYSATLSQGIGRFFNYVKNTYSPDKIAIYYLDEENKLQIGGKEGLLDNFVFDGLDTLAAVNPEKLILITETIDENKESYQLITLRLSLDGSAYEARIYLIIYGLNNSESETASSHLERFLEQVRNCFEELFKNSKQILKYEERSAFWEKASGLLDQWEYLSSIIEAAINVVSNAGKGSLYLWDETSKKLIIRAQKNFSGDLVNIVKLNSGEGYGGWVYQTGQPLILNNVWEDKRTKVLKAQEVNELKAAICVPLKAFGKMLGVLCLDSTEKGKNFEGRDLLELNPFANHASQVIYSHLLRQEFYDLGLNINRSDIDEKKVFDHVSSSIFKLFPVKAINMLLLDVNYDLSRDGEVKPTEVFQTGFDETFTSTVTIRPKGLTSKVLDTKLPVQVNSPKDPLGINQESLRHGVKANIALPLIFENQVLGAFYVHYSKVHIFTEEEERILSLFVNQVALAINNLRQRRELELTDRVAWMGIILPDKAHELTQDLLPIKGAASKLKQKSPSQGPVRDHLNIILEYTEKVLENLGEIVKYPYSHQPEAVNVAEYVETEITELLKAQPKVLKKFNFRLQGNIYILVDRRWFAIVLKNLVRNASRAMENANKQILEINCRIESGKLKISLTNTGEPIPEEIRKYFFKKPIPENLKNEKGAGIGLLIVSRIIRRYEGAIWVAENDKDKVTLTFSLPYETSRPQKVEGPVRKMRDF